MCGRDIVVTVRRVSFDRAASYYDATRMLPDTVRAAIADILTAELAGRQPCLEIGVGTGRIALALHERGVALVGADIAMAMLKRLITNVGGSQPFPLVLADASELPLADAAFGAVIASHVLHLIPDWRAVVDEAMRVLRRGGVLLADFGGRTPAPWSDACDELFRRHQVFRVRPGVSVPGSVASHLAGRAAVRPLPAVAMTVRRSLQQDLTGWERQIYAWTWPYAPDQMRQACAGIRVWAAEQGWQLDQEAELDRSIQWWSFERRSTA